MDLFSNSRLYYSQTMLWQKEKLKDQNLLPYSDTYRDSLPSVTRSDLRFRGNTFFHLPFEIYHEVFAVLPYLTLD